MAADLADTVQKFIASPPGQLAAGATLAGIVWKFFERVEAVLTDQTKFEIAVWLVGMRIGQNGEPWPDTFAKVFDRVFGSKHLSWRCLYRSTIASLAVYGLMTIWLSLSGRWEGLYGVARMVLFIVILGLTYNAVPDYISLLKTRLGLNAMRRTDSPVLHVLILSVDFYLTTVIASAVYILAMKTRMTVYEDSVAVPIQSVIARLFHNLAHFTLPLTRADIVYLLSAKSLIHDPRDIWVGIRDMNFYPAFVSCGWLWLYALSGFILKGARRFDLGFQWFNRKFDIEKKPLQALGLVAGALVAIIYWGLALTAHFLHA